MSLTQSQIDRFHEDGFLKVEDALTPEDLNPVIWEFETMVDKWARELFGEGKLSSLCETEPFDRRIARLADQCPDVVGPLSPMQTKGAAIFNLIRNPKILDILEPLLGSEIMCHPTQVVRPRMANYLDTNPRWKPTHGSPWHQDAGVLQPEVDDTLLITVWIPLTSADVENGCLSVIPGSHKQGVRTHVTTNSYKIPADELPPGEPVALPVEPGGILLFHVLTCHVSGPHASERVRWSIDLRYQDPAQPSGHPYLEGFMVRSRSNPERELNYAEWVSMWEKQLEHDEPLPPIPRWPGSH